MVRIAICDDDKETVVLHEDIVKRSLQACGIGYEITTYTQSSNLLYDITDDHFFYDLILLDIEMPDVTGMEISERIKPYLPNVKNRACYKPGHLPDIGQRVRCPRQGQRSLGGLWFQSLPP